MARVFFLDGQSKIIGFPVGVPHFLQNFSVQSFSLKAFNFSALLPVDVTPSTIGLFMTKFAATPVPPVLAAYVVSYAEFILPIMLVLGLGLALCCAWPAGPDRAGPVLHHAGSALDHGYLLGGDPAGDAVSRPGCNFG